MLQISDFSSFVGIMSVVTRADIVSKASFIKDRRSLPTAGGPPGSEVRITYFNAGAYDDPIEMTTSSSSTATTTLNE
jgi:hypothetical protein